MSFVLTWSMLSTDRSPIARIMFELIVHLMRCRKISSPNLQIEKSMKLVTRALSRKPSMARKIFLLLLPSICVILKLHCVLHRYVRELLKAAAAMRRFTKAYMVRCSAVCGPEKAPKAVVERPVCTCALMDAPEARHGGAQ